MQIWQEELQIWKLRRMICSSNWIALKTISFGKLLRLCGRPCISASARRIDIKNCGSVKGVLHKIAYKKNEKEAMKQFGTKSFPDETRAKEERETVFPRMPKISILVPLWNNEKEFQIEMLDSVMNQTYQNWELCLADGSDDAHSYMGEISKEYASRSNGRIVYKKLEKNEGISGNTNACLAMATR